MSGNNQVRRNWTRSLTVVMIIAAVAVVIGCLVDVKADKTDRMYFKNTAGAVLFDHGVHSTSAEACVQCHHDLRAEKKASSCRECHPGLQQSETNTVPCLSCHDDSYSSDMISHDEYLEVDEHSCLGCHTPRSVSDAYHANCSNCHLENSRERFTKADGELLCGACHLR